MHDCLTQGHEFEVVKRLKESTSLCGFLIEFKVLLERLLALRCDPARPHHACPPSTGTGCGIMLTRSLSCQCCPGGS